MRIKVFAIAVLSAAWAGTPAAAQPAGALKALSDCRAVQGDSARLACFDAAAARLTAEAETGAVVVLDREQVQAARRQAFGFSLPKLDLFGGTAADPSDRVALTLSDARPGAEDRWVFRTQDGQVWRQTDTEKVRGAKAGSTAVVRRAAMGSFLMSIDGQRSIRVRREQ